MMLYSAVKFFFKGWFKLFYRHATYGKEHYPISGGAIIAPNHASFWDPPVIGISSPGEVFFIARSTLFGTILGPFIRALNTYPVKPSEQNLEALRLVTNLLEEGKKVVIFPEGHRTEDGHLGPFKSGVAMLALRAHCPIIPVYIHGTYTIWDRTHVFPRFFGKTACVFGTPISCEPYLALSKKEAQEALSHAVRDSIEALENWYNAGAIGNPP